MSDSPGPSRPPVGASPNPSAPGPRIGSLLLVLCVAAAMGYLALRSLRTDWARAPARNLADQAREDLERRGFRPLSGPLETLIRDPAYRPTPTQEHPLLGRLAPDFTLPDVDGKPWSLARELKEGPVVLVFYYGYHCNHCVSQLFGLHKDLDRFQELGARVVAVSADPPELTRERFRTYGPFAFPVLSDPGHAIAALYGTWTAGPKPGEEGDLQHGTFVIDRQGRVVWANRGDSPFTENRTLLIETHRSEER